ncbi:MAG: hypothetical protein LBI34_01930 [Puniceicoccales bacterium]|nr:hypothetical protein [Puniceicoccales bacterium]
MMGSHLEVRNDALRDLVFGYQSVANAGLALAVAPGTPDDMRQPCLNIVRQVITLQGVAALANDTRSNCETSVPKAIAFLAFLRAFFREDDEMMAMTGGALRTCIGGVDRVAQTAVDCQIAEMRAAVPDHRRGRDDVPISDGPVSRADQ